MEQTRRTNAFIGSPVERVEDLRFLRGRGQYVDDLTRAGHAACRDPAQPGRPWPHPLDRRRGGAGDAGRACGDDGGRYRQPVPTIPLRLRPLPAVRALRAAGDRARTRCAMSASRWRWWWPTAPRSPRTRWRRSRSTSRRLPAVADRRRRRAGRCAAVRGEPAAIAPHAHGRARRCRGGVPRPPPIRGARRFQVQRLTAMPMETRGLLAEWDAASGQLTVYGAAKVPFFNRRTLAQMMGSPRTRST